MKYFIDEDQRVTSKDIGSIDLIKHFAKSFNAKIKTLDLEFQQGQYHDKCWLDTSISISDEIWNSRHVSDLILEVIPEFDFYGMTIVTKVQWDNILTKSQSDGCTCKEIIAEAVPWAAKCFETNDVFTIIGM